MSPDHAYKNRIHNRIDIEIQHRKIKEATVSLSVNRHLVMASLLFCFMKLDYTEITEIWHISSFFSMETNLIYTMKM